MLTKKQNWILSLILIIKDMKTLLFSSDELNLKICVWGSNEHICQTILLVDTKLIFIMQQVLYKIQV